MADFQIENGVLVKYTGTGGDVTVPEGVTSIGDFAFSECESVVSVVLPEGLTSIGSYAFLGCDNLKRIIIPQSVTVIGSGAFSSCTSLEAVTLPKHIAAIGDDTFFACINLANIAISKSVTSIGSKAFCCCWKLTNIAIPEGVTGIGNSAFCCCHGLTSITIPGSVTSIGDWAFRECDHLARITIPEGVRSIGSRAFSECKSLVSVTLPQSLTDIGDNAFEWCRRLAGIVIPDNVTSFGRDVFLNYTCLLVISLPKTAERVMSSFLGGEGFKTGVILRSGGKYEYIAFSARAASHNLSALTARESGWAPYDTQLISNGPRFKYTLSARLLGALGRLHDPEGLTERNREMLLDILSKNILKLVPLAELTRCPEMIQAAVETGAVNASNRKALRKLLSASPIPEISALATQKLTASAPEKKKNTPASPLAAEYTRKLKAINGENLLKNMRSIEARMPAVLLKDGTPAPKALLLYILVSYCAQYIDGFCEFVPEADAAAELLQYDSLCEAMEIVSDHLNVIIYPTLLPLLCRFGTPAQIQRMIDSAQDWQRLGKKGQRGEKALREFMNLSNTRAAVLWLHGLNRLRRYAELRNLSIDVVYEKYIANDESPEDNAARP